MATKFEVVLTASLSKESINKIENQIKQLGKTKVDLTGSLGNTSSAMKKLTESTNEASVSADNLFGKVENYAKRQIINRIVYQTIDATKEMIDKVFELDAALVEFNKVTDLSEGELKQFTEQAYETGEAIAKTGIETINLATEFSKAGYKEEALYLARVAGMYQNVADGELSASEASSFLVAQLKAFNLEASQAEHVIDAINEVDIRASRYRNVA